MIKKPCNPLSGPDGPNKASCFDRPRDIFQLSEDDAMEVDDKLGGSDTEPEELGQPSLHGSSDEEESSLSSSEDEILT